MVFDDDFGAFDAGCEGALVVAEVGGLEEAARLEGEDVGVDWARDVGALVVGFQGVV